MNGNTLKQLEGAEVIVTFKIPINGFKSERGYFEFNKIYECWALKYIPNLETGKVCELLLDIDNIACVEVLDDE